MAESKRYFIDVDFENGETFVTTQEPGTYDRLWILDEKKAREIVDALNKDIEQQNQKEAELANSFLNEKKKLKSYVSTVLKQQHGFPDATVPTYLKDENLKKAANTARDKYCEEQLVFNKVDKLEKKGPDNNTIARKIESKVAERTGAARTK